jgi:hypothetical protein
MHMLHVNEQERQRQRATARSAATPPRKHAAAQPRAPVWLSEALRLGDGTKVCQAGQVLQVVNL